MCGVYEIRNLVNNKLYIGSSVDCEYRWRLHQRDLRNKKHHAPHLQFSFNKHGVKNFKFSILERADVPILLAREQHWIDATQCCNGEFGYNTLITAGSPLGHKHSEATRKKISEIQKGKVISKETRIKLSLAHTGKKKPADFGEKISKRDGFFLKGNRMEELLKLRASGMSCLSIAKVFECDRHTVSRALDGKQNYAKGLSDPIPPHLKDDGRKKILISIADAVKITRLRKSGIGAHKISTLLKCSRSIVDGIIYKKTKSYDYTELERLAA